MIGAAALGVHYSRRIESGHFDREVYGRVPKDVPDVKWEWISKESQSARGGTVIVKRLVGRADNSSYRPIAVEILLTLETPETAVRPVPVILDLAWDERRLSSGGRGRPAWDEVLAALSGGTR